RARPNAGEEAAFRERHMGATSEQAQHEHYAASNHGFLASENHGRPSIAATSRPGEFNRGVVAARPGTMHNDSPRAMGNPHSVPRPSSQPGRMQQGSPHPTGFNGGQHEAPRPAARTQQQR